MQIIFSLLVIYANSELKMTMMEKWRLRRVTIYRDRISGRCSDNNGRHIWRPYKQKSNTQFALYIFTW